MMSWNESLLKVLAAIGIARRTDLIARVSDTHPAPVDLPPGRLVLVRNGSLEKAACFRCPGGCGVKIVLPLTSSKRPIWRVQLDWLRRPTVEPSVRQLNECQCHFWIRRGLVEWCSDSRRGRREPGSRVP